MARALRELARQIDKWQDRLGRGVSWLMLLMVAVVFADVVLRYLFSISTVFTQEFEWYLFGVVYLMAAGYTMLYDEHVRVDIVYSRFSPRKKAWFDFVLLFVFFFPSCLLVIITAWPFVRNAFQVLEGSPDPGGIPARWALKAVIIIGFAVLMLQGVSQAIKSFFWGMGWERPPRLEKEIL